MILSNPKMFCKNVLLRDFEFPQKSWSKILHNSKLFLDLFFLKNQIYYNPFQNCELLFRVCARLVETQHMVICLGFFFVRMGKSMYSPTIMSLE